MKKLLLVITMFTLLLCSACSTRDEPMTFFPAGFTRQEADLLKLLGKENDQYIFDFVLDGDVKTMDIVVWQLEGKEWKERHSMSRQFIDKRGRVAFEFDNIPEGVTVALQSENNSGRTKFDGQAIGHRMAVTTSFLENRHNIIYGTEIPVAVQIMTTKSMVTTYGIEYFEKPEDFAKEGYEAVYAITVKFEK